MIGFGVRGKGSAYGHVLDGEKGAVGAEEHVQVAGADQGVVGVLDDALQDVVLRGADALVAHGLIGGGVAEDAVDTLVPVGGRGVDGLLHVGAVEVDLGAWWGVVALVDFTEDRVGVGAGLGDVVDVEARVHLEDSRICVGELITRIVVCISLSGKDRELLLRRRVGEVLVEVISVTALVVTLPKALHEGLVEVEDVLPVLEVRRNDHLLLGSVVAEDRVVDVDTLERHVRVVGGDEGVCDVRDVVATVALSSEVEVPALNAECLNKLLVETDKLLAELVLVGDVGCSLGETHANGLLNPHHVGEVDPGVRVLDRSKSASLPGEGTVLGQQTTEGTATRASIEPDGDLLLRVGVGGGEEPEEKLAGLIGVARDGEKASIALTDIEVDIWDGGTVDDELLSCIVEVVVGALAQALVLELLVGDPLLDDGLVGALGLCEGLLSRAEG